MWRQFLPRRPGAAHWLAQRGAAPPHPPHCVCCLGMSLLVPSYSAICAAHLEVLNHDLMCQVNVLNDHHRLAQKEAAEDGPML